MASYAATYPLRSFDFGRAFAHVFTAVWRNAPVLLVLNGGILLVSFILKAGLGAALSTPNPRAAQPFDSGPIIVAFVTLLLGLVQIVFLNASVSYLVGKDLAEQPLSFAERLRDCVGVCLRKSLPLIGLWIVQWIAIYVGMMLLIIPGLILSMVWFVTSPALVNEDIGVFAALSRSAELTRDHRWVLFGFSLVTGVLMSVACYAVLGVSMLLFAGAAYRVDAAARPAVMAGWLVLSAAFTVFGSVALSVPASAYHELRRIKEGGQDVAKVFS